MTSLRCIGLLLIVLVSACDPQKTPAPAPKVAAEAQVAAPPASVAPPVHDLLPNVPVVPVTVAQGQPAAAKKLDAHAAKTPVSKAASTKSKSEQAPVKPRAPIASKTQSAAEAAQQTRLPQPNLDLSLPADMVKEMVSVGKVGAGKVGATVNTPLLPAMFSDKKTAPESPFQLNGRLLNNAMNLQLRDENRRQVEGAALDFEFKH